MFTLTAAAAARIRQAAVEGGMAELALRVAARRENDGSITYGMGFDEPGEGEQPSLQSDGVTVLIASSSRPLLQDTQLDFVELEPGEFNFIFVPQVAAPRGKSGCGSCSSGGCATC
jgi:iron-sulfur cluster assembly protein